MRQLIVDRAPAGGSRWSTPDTRRQAINWQSSQSRLGPRRHHPVWDKTDVDGSRDPRHLFNLEDYR